MYVEDKDKDGGCADKTADDTTLARVSSNHVNFARSNEHLLLLLPAKVSQIIIASPGPGTILHMVKTRHDAPPPLLVNPAAPSDFADHVARYVNDFYLSLNVRAAKPQPGQWTVLASFLACRSVPGRREEEIQILSLATGVKCLGGDVQRRDEVLVDMHAEVLARRELELLLMEELEHHAADTRVTGRGKTSLLESVENVGNPRYRLRSDTKIWLYTSHAPCGAASNAAHLARLDEEDRMLRSVLRNHGIKVPPVTSDFRSSKSAIMPRPAKKPSRADAAATTAYTCSDKLSRYQVLGLQGARLSGAIIQPIRMTGIILAEDYDEDCLYGLFGGATGKWSRVIEGVREALSGRGGGRAAEWLSGIPRDFLVLPTSIRFKYGREQTLADIDSSSTYPAPTVDPAILHLPLPLLRDHLLPKVTISPCSIGSSYHASSHVEVFSPQGRLAGVGKNKSTKQWDEKSVSRLARGEMWKRWWSYLGVQGQDKVKGCQAWRDASQALESSGPFMDWHNEGESLLDATGSTTSM